jgi:hypothetical protein
MPCHSSPLAQAPAGRQRRPLQARREVFMLWCPAVGTAGTRRCGLSREYTFVYNVDTTQGGAGCLACAGVLLREPRLRYALQRWHHPFSMCCELDRCLQLHTIFKVRLTFLREIRWILKTVIQKVSSNLNYERLQTP